MITTSSGREPVEDTRFFRAAALSLSAGGETVLALDSSEGALVAGLALDGGDVLWSNAATTLHGHLSAQYTGVAALAGITMRIKRVRGGVEAVIEEQPWKAVVSVGTAALPDVAVRIPVEPGDRIRVTLQPSGALLAVPLVVGSIATHLDLHPAGAG